MTIKYLIKIVEKERILLKIIIILNVNFYFNNIYIQMKNFWQLS